jgi:uncharacterized protein YcbK (DUF882 family)
MRNVKATLLMPQKISRRSFLLATLPTPAWAMTGEAATHESDFWIRPRTIRCRHISGEWIESTYWSDGQLIEQAYAELSWFMRDRVVNRAVGMNPVLLDVAYGITGWLTYFGVHSSLVLTSGHRDRVRNAQIEGAAKNSLHITGDAMDVRIPGISTLQLARFGRWLGAGGVGWYPSKDFTHLDRGRLRSWRG